MIEIEAVLHPIPITIVSHHTYKVLDSLDMPLMCIWVSLYLYFTSSLLLSLSLTILMILMMTPINIKAIITQDRYVLGGTKTGSCHLDCHHNELCCHCHMTINQLAINEQKRLCPHAHAFHQQISIPNSNIPSGSCTPTRYHQELIAMGTVGPGHGTHSHSIGCNTYIPFVC